MCVCVCAQERQRARERDKGGEGGADGCVIEEGNNGGKMYRCYGIQKLF